LTDQKTGKREYLFREEIIDLGTAYSILLPPANQAISLITGQELTIENRGGVMVQINEIHSEAEPIGLIKVNFDRATANISLLDLVAQSDIEKRKSILSMPEWPSVIEPSKVLFIPSTGVGIVYICPDAKSLDEVNPLKATIWLRVGETKDGMTLTTTIYDSREYYMVYGITGSGAGEAPKITSCDAQGNEKDQFNPGESVYVKGEGLEPNTPYKIWIQKDPVDENKLLNLDEDPSRTQELVTTNESGKFDPVCIWQIPSDAPVAYYDVLVDKQNDGDNTGKYNLASDGIDSAIVVGFFVTSEPPAVILLLIGLLVVAGHLRIKKREDLSRKFS
jgi:hypothetical protein